MGNCISKLEPIVKDALNNNDNHYHFQHLIIIIHLNFCQVLKSELFFFQYIIIPPIIMIADPSKLTSSGNEL